jgi:hypothetical protein
MRQRHPSTLCLVGLAIGVLIFPASKREEAPKALPPPDVLVTDAATRDVPVYREWIGTLDGSETAEVIDLLKLIPHLLPTKNPLPKPPSAAYSWSPAIPMNRLALIFDRCLLQVGLTACSNTSVSQGRTDAVQNRQDWMNSPAEAVAERRQIRSDNMDARIAATFDAM